jgi:saccharopine dehydrogenase-like NADP-dependent oxidoreductase
MHLRVGALPLHPYGQLGYAFNWSAEGVINEYINPCEVIAQGQPATVPALDQIETLRIYGQTYEAFTTSGGLGTMCETYAGVLKELNYKSIRYPGHGALMQFLLQELHLAEDRPLVTRILTQAKPPVDEDVVLIYASVEGIHHGKPARKEYVRALPVRDIDGTPWRAISWTTAASLVSVVEMVRAGTLPSKGFLRQEDIPFPEFLATQHGSFFA